MHLEMGPLLYDEIVHSSERKKLSETERDDEDKFIYTLLTKSN